MEYFIGLLAGGFVGVFVGVFVMAIISAFAKREDYERGALDGYKRGVTELQPFVKELQLREYVTEMEKQHEQA